MRTNARTLLAACLLCAVVTLLLLPVASYGQVLGDPVDVSQDFQRMENVYFVGSRVTSFLRREK